MSAQPSNLKLSCRKSKPQREAGKRRFKVTTDSNHDLPISPNLLNGEFTVAAPDKVWVGNITYTATAEGWLFLAVVMDLFSRQMVGW